MKKNLRIASAAAAALLAVAPVAASTVSPVFADDAAGINVPVNGSSDVTPNEAKLELAVTNASSLKDTDKATTVKVVLNTKSLPKNAVVNTAKANIYKTTDAEHSTVITDLVGGEKYTAVVKVSLSGLTDLAGKKVKVNGTEVNVNAQGISDPIEVTATFTVPDTKAGSPFVTEGTKTVDSGSIDFGTSKSVTDLVKLIDKDQGGKYSAASTGEATASFVDLKKDVTDALKAAGITVSASETFAKPAAPFTINVRVATSNGVTSTFPVKVNIDNTIGGDAYPQFTWTDATTNAEITTAVSGDQAVASIDSIKGGEAVNYVAVNGVVNTDAIKALFKATVNKNNNATLPLTVDASKVNTKVAGRYPVVVSATNADKKTSKVTFYLTVGVKGATYKTVQSNGEIPVYKIDGNTVTDSKTTVKNGDQIAVFGDTIKVGDKTYARINSADSDLYVESKYVDGTFKPADKVAKKVMHNAYIYDKDHKRVGTKTVAAYTNVNVLGAVTKLNDGTLAYQIDDNQYVLADNIDGTVRTLTHNAYVYKTSTKRADRRVLRKGAKVTTYGAPYKFKNGVSYYRIGGPAKQYVKVANF